MTFVQAALQSRWTRAGAVVWLVGWAPLLLYVLVDWMTGGRGNPIGLGLLMVCSTPIALGLVVAGLVDATRRSRG